MIAEIISLRLLTLIVRLFLKRPDRGVAAVVVGARDDADTFGNTIVVHLAFNSQQRAGGVVGE